MTALGTEPAATPSGPLSGCKVLDFTRILSGPYATMLLADLGADVIKIEQPLRGDDTRSWGPPFWRDASSYFAAINRGKRSIVIDLASDDGRRLAHELIAASDVVVENFRPGVTGRLGISHADVADSNPTLIYASITGFGSSGPRAEQAGTEVIIEAESGLMAMMGTPDGPPVRFGIAMVDIATGMALVNGVLAAMLERIRTGHGRAIECPLYATAISVMATVIASASIAPEIDGTRFGSGHPSIVPYSAFEARDGWIVVGAVNEQMWTRLCAGLGLHDLTHDQRCATNAARVRNRVFVEGVVAGAIAGFAVREITESLRSRGVLVAPVKTARDAILDPQVAALGLIDDDDGVPFARTPLAQFNHEQLSRAPRLGEHSREVLRSFGIADDRVGRLLDAHVVHQADPP